MNLEFDKKEEFKPIVDVKLKSTKLKKNSIGVIEGKIRTDATIPLQSLGDMRKWRTQMRRSIRSIP